MVYTSSETKKGSRSVSESVFGPI